LAAIIDVLQLFGAPMTVLLATIWVLRPGARESYQRQAQTPFADEEIHQRTLRRVSYPF
jgi:cbb3-type cytochrome oxidase subunit 3